MGAVVMAATGERHWQIIDGQQRLATLSLLTLAVIRHLERLSSQGVDATANGERAVELRATYVGRRDPASLVESSRLFLNEADDGFYQDYLVQLRAPLNARALSQSNSLLWQCLEFFGRRLAEQDGWRSDGEMVAKLISETVAWRLLFILITVEDEVSAYTVFETLNARGMELTTTDLLKNYLFSRVKVVSDLQFLQRQWKRLMDTVRPERFPEFLRYHLQCTHPQVRNQRVFKMVRDVIPSPQAVFDFIKVIEPRADLYDALTDVENERWRELPDAKIFIAELALFGARQMTPLLFAAWERLTPDDFVSVLRTVSVLTFRYTVVGRLNPNELEAVYHAAAAALLAGTAVSPAQVFEHLKDVYVTDDKFAQDFASMAVPTRGRSKRLAKYVLSRLETDASHKAIDWNTDPGTVEHILPENAGESWDECFPEPLRDGAVYRLGNLTLLEPRLNRRVGTMVFADKVPTYDESQYVMTSNLARLDIEEWSFAHLEKRQRELAKRARHLWRVDFQATR